MKSKKKEIKRLIPYFIASCLLLIVFFVVVDAYEYLTTEYYWIQNQINYAYSGLFFLFLVGALALIDWQKLFAKRKILVYLIFIIFLLSSFAHKKYLNYYNFLQRAPRVKSLSKNWGSGGSWVKIEGKNFGLAHEPGKIFLGEDEAVVKKWTKDEIIFEVPVLEEKGLLPILIEKQNQEANQTGFNYELREL